MIACLDYCHSVGVVHKDVKPANFMISLSGDVKLADFGCAERLDRYEAAQADGTRIDTCSLTQGSPAFQVRSTRCGACRAVVFFVPRVCWVVLPPRA